MSDDGGIFIISLDLELHWGVVDSKNLESYRENLLGVRKCLDSLLELFEEYGIRSTWGVVGFLFCREREELEELMPEKRPSYERGEFSNYRFLEEGAVGKTETEDPLHYGTELIDRIQSVPGQEIGSHTFSHYYCLEEGQTPAAFRADLRAAKEAAARRNVELTSLILPRNQADDRYLRVAAEEGFGAYRGNKEGWIYSPAPQQEKQKWLKLPMVVEDYLGLLGPYTYPRPSRREGLPLNLPASQFLRPYYPGAGWLQRLQGRLIRRQLRRAAEEGEIFHLWWHPHNFGNYPDKNLNFLEEILEYFTSLKRDTGIQSLNMAETVERIED